MGNQQSSNKRWRKQNNHIYLQLRPNKDMMKEQRPLKEKTVVIKPKTSQRKKQRKARELKRYNYGKTKPGKD